MWGKYSRCLLPSMSCLGWSLFTLQMVFGWGERHMENITVCQKHVQRCQPKWMADMYILFSSVSYFQEDHMVLQDSLRKNKGHRAEHTMNQIQVSGNWGPLTEFSDPLCNLNLHNYTQRCSISPGWNICHSSPSLHTAGALGTDWCGMDEEPLAVAEESGATEEK